MMINFTKCLEEIEMKLLDNALSQLDLSELEAYEEAIELWVTYGGD
tara:strand:- start:116 stop:253 length:138 start_codon:yes stop_codon:yes gene_type:complete